MSAPVALPAAPLLPAAIATAASPVVVILDGAAQALATLTSATQLSGTVTESDTPGELTLLTALGTLALKTPLALPEGTRLVLQAIADRPGAAIVVAINDSPTASRAAAPALAAAAPPSPPTAPPPAVLALGTTVTATIVGSAGYPLLDSRLAAAPESALFATPTARAAAGEPASANPAAAGGTAAAVPQDRGPATGPLARIASTDRTAPVAPGQATTVPAGTAPLSARPSPTAPADAFRLAAPGSNLALRILAVQPAAPAGSPAAPALSGVVRPSPPALPGMLVDTPAGLLRLYPDTDPAAGRRAAVPVPPGTPVALRLLAGAPPAALLTVLTDAPAPTAAEPAEPETAPAGKTAAGAGTPAPPRDAAEAVQLGPRASRVLLNAPAPTPPGPRQAAEMPGAPPLVVGTVVAGNAASADATTLIATPLGTLAVNEPLALPTGTLLLLAAQPDDAGALDPRLGDPPSRFDPARLDRGWPALEATLGTLGNAAPELAAHLRADLSMQSGERLAASLMVLVAALRNNTPHLWPGDAVEHALSAAGHDDLKLKLGEEFAEISRLADNPATNPWQVFLLPLIEGAAVRPVRLYLKRRSERGRRDATEDSARFVLEFELTRLGVLQLDGFVRPQRFDLVLRSHAALAAPLRSAVERIFYDRVAAAGIAGSIDFAAAARFDVAPLDGLRAKVGLAV